MSQKLILGFPISVVLAFGLLALVLLALARVLAAMRRPAPPRAPCQAARERIDAFDPEEAAGFRLGRLEIAPLGERGRRNR